MCYYIINGGRVYLGYHLKYKRTDGSEFYYQWLTEMQIIIFLIICILLLKIEDCFYEVRV